MYQAIVVDGYFVKRHPDECGVTLVTDYGRRDLDVHRHICQDYEFNKLLDADASHGTHCGVEPASKRRRVAVPDSLKGIFNLPETNNSTGGVNSTSSWNY